MKLLHLNFLIASIRETTLLAIKCARENAADHLDHHTKRDVNIIGLLTGESQEPKKCIINRGNN